MRIKKKGRSSRSRCKPSKAMAAAPSHSRRPSPRTSNRLSRYRRNASLAITFLAATLICFVGVAKGPGLLPGPEQISTWIGKYEHLLIEFTRAGGLTLICFRLLWTEVSKLLGRNSER